jgi:Fe-S-cluster containining protein
MNDATSPNPGAEDTDEEKVNEEKVNEEKVNGAELPAGEFAAWLAGMQAAIRGEQESDVPCGACTACCTSYQFVRIEPDETETLAHIPNELLFPAPRAPRGHVLMGYDERGHCPMLVDGKCSIYAHRPRTCRAYDCRIFPATGVEVDADDDTKVAIGLQSRRWRFSFPTDRDRVAHEATRAAAASLRERDDAPLNATGLAVLAIESGDSSVVHGEDTSPPKTTSRSPTLEES